MVPRHWPLNHQYPLVVEYLGFHLASQQWHAVIDFVCTILAGILDSAGLVGVQVVVTVPAVADN